MAQDINFKELIDEVQNDPSFVWYTPEISPLPELKFDFEDTDKGISCVANILDKGEIFFTIKENWLIDNGKISIQEIESKKEETKSVFYEKVFLKIYAEGLRKLAKGM